MRSVSGVLLWVVATVSGGVGAAWFSLAGLGWSNGFIKRSYWEEGESEIGVAFAVILLLVWLVLLSTSSAVMRGGSPRPARATLVTSRVLTGIGVALICTLCLLTIGWPEPPSEFPSTPWNRA